MRQFELFLLKDTTTKGRNKSSNHEIGSHFYFQNKIPTQILILSDIKHWFVRDIITSDCHFYLMGVEVGNCHRRSSVSFFFTNKIRRNKWNERTELWGLRRWRNLLKISNLSFWGVGRNENVKESGLFQCTKCVNVPFVWK